MKLFRCLNIIRHFLQELDFLHEVFSGTRKSCCKLAGKTTSVTLQKGMEESKQTPNTLTSTFAPLVVFWIFGAHVGTCSQADA